jgi:hypothetical protein
MNVFSLKHDVISIVFFKIGIISIALRIKFVKFLNTDYKN